MSKTTQNTPVSPQSDTPTVQTGVTPTVQTADTPAEVVYQPEGSLPPITSLDDLSQIRAIDKQGRSVTMTPAQIRELTGIDYSKLEEQIVPGEHWVGADGVRRQVYTRTFIGTSPPDKGGAYISASPIYEQMSLVAGFFYCREGSELYVTATNIGQWSYECYVSNKSIALAGCAERIRGKQYILIIQYTKL